MDRFLTFTAAVCAGISAGSFFYIGIKILSNAKLESRDADSGRSFPILIRMLMPLCGLFRNVVKKHDFSTWKKSAAINLGKAGFTDDEFSAEDYIALRFVFFLIALIILSIGALAGKMTITCIMAILLSIYPEAWIRGVIKQRHTEIMKALPNLLDLLTLSVESGRDLISSLRDILDAEKEMP